MVIRVVVALTILAGALLLFFGRRLYWLFVGVMGFFAGWTLATRYFHPHDQLILLIASIGIGLLGIVPLPLAQGATDEQALLAAMKCERTAHRFFRRYGEQFEDSEGKHIFLEVADEERSHLELLTREYRASSRRRTRTRRQPSGRARRAQA